LTREAQGPAGQVRGLHGAYESRSHAVGGRRSHRAESGRQNAGLSHLTPAIDSIADDTCRDPVAKYFEGEIIVGKDLMVV
jgi:hypothetical protein